MDVDNISSAGDFEFIEEIALDAQALKPSNNGAEHGQQQCHFEVDNSQQLDDLKWMALSPNFVEMLRSEFKAEIDALKTENKVLLAKVDSLQSENGELKAQMKVIKLESKSSSEQMAKVVEITVKVEKDQQKFGEQIQLVSSKLAKEDHLIKNKEQFNAFNQQKIYKEELANEIQQKNMEKEWEWSSNKWDGLSCCQAMDVLWGGLIVTNTNMADEKNMWNKVRACIPVSSKILASNSAGQQQLAYYEVHLMNKASLAIGWLGPDFPLECNKYWIGRLPGSYAIDCHGTYLKSGSFIAGYANGFSECDVVGSGLLLLQDRRLMLFFTKNGRLNGKPIAVKNKALLYPAVGFYSKDASVEANFGADPERKPFKFDFETHKAQLVVE